MPLKLLSTGGGSVLLSANTTGSDFTVNVPPENGTMFTSASLPVSIANGGTGRSTAPAYFYGYQASDGGGGSAATWNKASIDTSVIDNASGFSVASNRYTVQSGRAGYYKVSARARMRYNSGTQSNQNYMAIYKNGSAYTYSEFDVNTSLFWTITHSINLIMNLSVGDYIEVYGYATNMAWYYRGTDTSLQLTQLYGV